eukprot:CAMPEP_0116921018 /NCGR_PEP_ID=MMETSP0467-20121206/21371_1 /TAXON_ID=283647 /ORGANISM="Mesodinium pulex, Strain SPMC105" /LENGTH=70 /DNA_ID=CAMNT_0004598987 /DNA_START=873 /DNA_END=1085 /DNA_ORIENTATION=-
MDKDKNDKNDSIYKNNQDKLEMSKNDENNPSTSTSTSSDLKDNVNLKNPNNSSNNNKKIIEHQNTTIPID